MIPMARPATTSPQLSCFSHGNYPFRTRSSAVSRSLPRTGGTRVWRDASSLPMKFEGMVSIIVLNSCEMLLKV